MNLAARETSAPSLPPPPDAWRVLADYLDAFRRAGLSHLPGGGWNALQGPQRAPSARSAAAPQGAAPVTPPPAPNYGAAPSYAPAPGHSAAPTYGAPPPGSAPAAPVQADSAAAPRKTGLHADMPSFMRNDLAAPSRPILPSVPLPPSERRGGGSGPAFPHAKPFPSEPSPPPRGRPSQDDRPSGPQPSRDAPATGRGGEGDAPPRRVERAAPERGLFGSEIAPPPVLPAPQRVAQLKVLQEEVRGCTACGELAATRTQTVFGVGNPAPRLVFFGEAPGADEDRLGEPFVGAAGQLLTKMIEGCSFRREDVYIMNVLKCRPPGNRTPAPEEAANCRRFFERQLEILRPEFICCLGRTAAQTLLETTQSITGLRKRFFQWRWAKVVCTYHPSYLLRSPDQKREAWEDLKMLLREMGVDWTRGGQG